MSYFCHESAVVDEGAQIGPDSRVWHFSHICAGAVVGARVSMGQNVFIANRVKVGDDCKIQNNVSIYDNVTLEDGVFCGPSMVFTNVYNPRARVSRKDEYRDTRVRDGATLGANCTVICGHSIGRFAFVAAGAVVNRNIGDYELVAGVPGRRIGWMSESGERLDLPLDGDGEALCPGSQQRYVLEDGVCRRLE